MVLKVLKKHCIVKSHFKILKYCTMPKAHKVLKKSRNSQLCHLFIQILIFKFGQNVRKNTKFNRFNFFTADSIFAVFFSLCYINKILEK